MSSFTLEVDGRPVEVTHGSTVMEACNKLGIYVPHFCYHKKLSIAANCRMCLVDIEKAPKPQPACATPATENMKVWTHSANAKKAQNGVMEFLLINHPLDCPICDQGGECQLQDLAVGYGKSASRFAEEKRVVLAKDIGPLVAAEEMSRCIQCTRCVRFGQEVAGVMELGMIGRGEHSEIVSFVGRSVDSELSGNMIDLCPVGALTSRPFRYSARTWELARRRSVSPHDSVGANLVVQTKQNRVMRVLPLENEAVNECWISDKDRYSYDAVNSPERLTAPMVKREGDWVETDWESALEAVTTALKAAGSRIGFLASPHSTLEELALTARLARATGGIADHRLRESDFSADGLLEGIPWLGMPIASLAELDRIVVIGSFLRKDHALLATRLRQATKRRAQLSIVHCADDDPLMPVANRVIVAPSQLPAAVAALAEGPVGASLRSGRNTAVLLGNFARQHPSAAQIHAHALALARASGAQLGFLGEAANSVGGGLAGFPVGGNLRGLLEKRPEACVLVHAEPEFDCADPAAAVAAMKAARFVVALSAFRTAASAYAQVLLPIAPFTETSGTFVNTEGRAQSFHAAVRPLGETRPAWKVLRVLGNLLGLPGFDEETSEEVRDRVLAGVDIASRLSNGTRVVAVRPAAGGTGALERVADVPIHFADPLARRSGPLQKTRDSRAPRASMNAATLSRLGVRAGARIRVTQGEGHAELAVALDDGLPDGCVRIPAGHAATSALGAMCGTIEVAPIAASKAA